VSLQAVVLAAGLGRKAFPLGVKKPKPMFEILGKPLLGYVLDSLAAAGIMDVIVVCGHLAPQVQDYVSNGDRWGLRIRYTLQEHARGMADALRTAEHLLADHFLMVNGDDVFEADLLVRMLAELKDTGADLVLAGRQVDDPSKFGVMQFEGSRLTGVVEKPRPGEEPSNYAVVGAYLFSPEIFSCLDATPPSEYQLEAAYQRLIDRGRASYVPYGGLYASFKYPWDLLSINAQMMDKLIAGQNVSERAIVSERAVVEGNVIIEDNVRVFENAVIRGPAFVGKGAVIGNNTLIRNYSAIGAGAVIGFSSEINCSLIGRDTYTHIAYVGDSVIDDRCSLGAGTITANWRFDELPVKVKIGETAVSSGRTKLGAFMAEGSKTGSNATLMPGVRVGPDSIVGTGVTLHRDLPPGKMAVLRQQYGVLNNRFAKSDE